MRPVPSIILCLLMLALCGLCVWQWDRESRLRQAAAGHQDEIAALAAQRDELETRVKAADAEVLRMTGMLNELRGKSVPNAVHEDVIKTNAALRDTAQKQSAMINEQNELLAKQNAAMQQVNESIKKLATQRDDLARRLNDTTTLFNKSAAAPSSPPTAPKSSKASKGAKKK